MQYPINKKILLKYVGISEWQLGRINFKCPYNLTGATMRYTYKLF
jgi:hypothetical protein